MVVSKQNNGFKVNAYQGDAKTLLAWNLSETKAKNLAGFTIQCQPPGQKSYYLINNLRFQKPGDHAQVATESPNSSVNAPFHKFRWLHVPGSFHQGTKPTFGQYTYTVTPRYFDDNQHLKALDSTLSVAVKIDVEPFIKGGLQLGFTRGFVQSQAYVNHFGPNAVIDPDDHDLIFDTSKNAGTNKNGDKFSWADQYEWLGFTARERIFEIIEEVVSKKNLHLDVFAYDLNEPDFCAALLELAKQGRVRIILDNASLHTGGTPEDEFEKEFNAAAKDGAALIRGRFARYAHDKVLIVKDGNAAVKVLTGSTNFSITGLYVNSNHVLIFNDAKVAQTYEDVFQKAWDLEVSSTFRDDGLAKQPFNISSKSTPSTSITFSPHNEKFATQIISQITDAIEAEAKREASSVMFAVMGLSSGGGTLLPELRDIHSNDKTFSYGISDAPGGVYLYSPGSSRGVLVTGKATKSKLPPPFDQVPSVGQRHQIHHKFVVCGFNGPDPIVICGSSNLTTGGEQANGDNLITIKDGDVATAFAIEAVALVDHFEFLDRFADAPKANTVKKTASKQKMAADAGWFLITTDAWCASYYNEEDLRSKDRELFGA